MTTFNADWASILSELFVNLATGWFGAVFIVPNFSGITSTYEFFLLTADLVLGTVSLLVAFYLRQISQFYD